MDILKFNSVEEKIITVRDISVIIDCDVAEIYGVETKRIIEAVSNNPEKFPEGFIFEIEKQEFMALRSKISTAKFSKTRYLPKAFTEQGLYMLATILKSSVEFKDLSLPVKLAKTNAGRRFAADKSENGNGMTTTLPFTKFSILFEPVHYDYRNLM